jgi:hypothetical protein
MSALNDLYRKGQINLTQKRIAEKKIIEANEMTGPFESVGVSGFGRVRVFYEKIVISIDTDGSTYGTFERPRAPE